MPRNKRKRSSVRRRKLNLWHMNKKKVMLVEVGPSEVFSGEVLEETLEDVAAKEDMRSLIHDEEEFNDFERVLFENPKLKCCRFFL